MKHKAPDDELAAGSAEGSASDLASPTCPSRISVGTIHIDLQRKEAKRAGRLLRIGPQEFRLLTVFAAHEGQVLSRERIRSYLWPEEHVDIRTIDVMVGRLRRALHRPPYPDVVLTLRGRGYRLLSDRNLDARWLSSRVMKLKLTTNR